MKRYIIFFLFFFFFVGCQESKIIKKDENEKVIPKADLKLDNGIEEDVNNLKEGISNLLTEESYSLEVKYLENDFYPASDYFAARILDLLANDLEPEWKDKEINEHQIELVFEGYKSIYVNTELETYWFEGSDEIFSAKGIKELWDRYIIKIIDNTPIYYEFEKTIISKIENYSYGDNITHEILLFYDGDIRLRIGESEIIVQEQLDLFSDYGNGTKYYSEIPKPSASVEYIHTLGLIMYIYEGYGAGGQFTVTKFYKYSNNQILEVFSSTNINVEIDISNFSTGIVDFKFPFEDTTKNLILTDKEVKFCEQTINNIMKSGINIDKTNLMLITDNIVFNEKGIAFEDYDNDNELELLIYGSFRTYGASTPLHLTDKVIYVFDLYPDRFKCIDIIFERDVDDTSSQFKYFTNIL